jgi:hypothetical protein
MGLSSLSPTKLPLPEAHDRFLSNCLVTLNHNRPRVQGHLVQLLFLLGPGYRQISETNGSYSLTLGRPLPG